MLKVQIRPESSKPHETNDHTRFCFGNAYTKLMTLCRRSNFMDMFFNFVSTILLHECFVKQACKFHFILDLENTYNPRDNKG